MRVKLDRATLPVAPCIVSLAMASVALSPIDFVTPPEFGCTEHQAHVEHAAIEHLSFPLP